MSAELEAAAIDSHREFFRRRPRHVRPVGSPCPNCEAALQGPWCHQCGQSAEQLHRSVLHLAAEAFEGFTHFDGRFWRTLPPLLLKPGKLTRDYIDGHRASQIPPLRLFLVVLLIFFFAGSLRHAGPILHVNTGPGAERESVEANLRKATAELGTHKQDARIGWVKQRLLLASQNPERFKTAVEAWSHRLAILLLPISAAILTVLFLFQRRFFVFDHLIFSMHSLSFLGLLLTLATLIRGPAFLLLLLAPIHLFVHMRGAYETGVVGTLARMALLFLASMVGFLGLLFTLFWIGLNAMGGH